MRETLLAALLATFALAAPASAETYPSHPITVVVPFSAGGPTDAMMRILGERMSLLDVYVTLVSRWTPRRRWFEEACPKLYQVVRRVDELAELKDFWKERFPFAEGWEA